MDLKTTEACQEVTNHLLNNEQYAYYETKYKVKNGEEKVRKPFLSTHTPLNCNQPM